MLTEQETGNAGKESDREGGLTEPYGGKSIATCCIHRDRAHDRKRTSEATERVDSKSSQSHVDKILLMVSSSWLSEESVFLVETGALAFEIEPVLSNQSSTSREFVPLLGQATHS